MICSLANVDDAKLAEIQKFEKESGKTTLVYSCSDIEPAALSEAELAEVQKFEKSLGFSVVAVKA